MYLIHIQYSYFDAFISKKEREKRESQRDNYGTLYKGYLLSILLREGKREKRERKERKKEKREKERERKRKEREKKVKREGKEREKREKR